MSKEKLFITHTNLEMPDHAEWISLQFQPPLSEIAIEGLTTLLTQHNGGFGYGKEHHADAVVVTNHDKYSTTLAMKPSSSSDYSNSGKMARAVYDLMDPGNLYDVSYNPDIPDAA